MKPKNQILEVWGELACFSRPEMKVERFSYPVITPSAARGIFDAIYCKPVEFRWQIKRIDILQPFGHDASSSVSYLALRRNEVKEKVSVNAVADWMKGGSEPVPIYADVDRDYWGNDTRGRTQRQTMALRDVHYYLHAEIRPWEGFENHIQALEGQFRRRAKHGKCIYQPYLGCREFPAWFSLIEEKEPPECPASMDMDVGLMLYDVFDLSRPGNSLDEPSISLFRASVKGGVLNVPEYDSPDVLKGERRAD